MLRCTKGLLKKLYQSGVFPSQRPPNSNNIKNIDVYTHIFTHAVCIIIYICNHRRSIRGLWGFCSTNIPCVRSVKRDSSASNFWKKTSQTWFPHICTPPPTKLTFSWLINIHHEWWTKMHFFHVKNGGFSIQSNFSGPNHQGMAQGFTALHAVPMFGRSNPSSARTVHLLMTHRCDATWRVWLTSLTTFMTLRGEYWHGCFRINGGTCTPKIIHLNRVFHINHPFWGVSPYFRQPPGRFRRSLAYLDDLMTWEIGSACRVG